MLLVTEKSNNIAVIVLQFESLEESNAEVFKREVKPFLEQNLKVIFDMSRVRFIDSIGLGAVLGCLRQANEAGGELKLCALSKSARLLFELVRLHRVFDILDTEEQAVRAFDL